MSGSREKDRRRAENDYKVNLKTESLIEDLYNKASRILIHQEAILRYIKAQEAAEAAAPSGTTSAESMPRE